MRQVQRRTGAARQFARARHVVGVDVRVENAPDPHAATGRRLEVRLRVGRGVDDQRFAVGHTRYDRQPRASRRNWMTATGPVSGTSSDWSTRDQPIMPSWTLRTSSPRCATSARARSDALPALQISRTAVPAGTAIDSACASRSASGTFRTDVPVTGMCHAPKASRVANVDHDEVGPTPELAFERRRIDLGRVCHESMIRPAPGCDGHGRSPAGGVT